MDSRERLDELWAIIKLAAMNTQPEYEAKLRQVIQGAAESAPLAVIVKLGTVIAEGQEDYLKLMN